MKSNNGVIMKKKVLFIGAHADDIELGCGGSITINQLAERFKKVSTKDIEVVYTPPRKGEVLHSSAKIDEAKNAFNFKPQISLEEGIKEYIDWVKSI